MSQLSQKPSPGLSGLLTRHLPDGRAHLYNSSDPRAPPVLLDGSHSIILRNLRCTDGGRYACHLSAPVGQQNREGEVLLRLTGEEPQHRRVRHLLPCAEVHAGLFADCPEGPAVAFDTFWAAVPVFALLFAFLAFGISYVSDDSDLLHRATASQRASFTSSLLLLVSPFSFV